MNHFRDGALKAGTRNLVHVFQRLDGEQQSEHETVVGMVALLKKFEVISNWLQTENDPYLKKRVMLYTARKVLERLCVKYSLVRRHLSAAADITHEPLFP